jgi:hypothetical protein
MSCSVCSGAIVPAGPETHTERRRRHAADTGHMRVHAWPRSSMNTAVRPTTLAFKFGKYTYYFGNMHVNITAVAMVNLHTYHKARKYVLYYFLSIYSRRRTSYTSISRPFSTSSEKATAVRASESAEDGGIYTYAYGPM